MNLIVTIDGPAGSGKSAVSNIVAKKFSLYVLDSGAIYRAITILGLRFADKHDTSVEEIIQTSSFRSYLSDLSFELIFQQYEQTIVVEGDAMGEQLYQPNITRQVKNIANVIFLRDFVNQKLIAIAKQYDVIANGRDMSTIVFPDAPLKFFLTADVTMRSKRKYQELLASNPNIECEQVLQDMIDRDKQDRNRKVGALKISKDVIFIDTTYLTLEHVVGVVGDHIMDFKG